MLYSSTAIMSATMVFAGVLSELAKYGIINICRAYGNWKNKQLSGWEEKLHPFAIKPIQQFPYTQGKNATDAAMIIDAMDLLYEKQIDAFALTTSDSDFTPLVMRILSNGLKVYGFGENEETGQDSKRAGKASRNELRGNRALVKLLRNAVEQTVEEDGWAHLGRVGQYISNNTSFSPINYGYKKLSDIIKISNLFKIEMRMNNSVMYIKDIQEIV